MAVPKAITKDRAERVARSIACGQCQEYSFKKLVVKRPSASNSKELKTVWLVFRSCGVCGQDQELGLDAEGDLIYSG